MTTTVCIEGAGQPTGEWAFDAYDPEGNDVDLTDVQYAAAVRVVEQPENADCERGTDCVNQRPVAWLANETKYGPDYIGFHLAEDPDTGYERMRFKTFYVTADGTAICEECAEGGDPA